ncbi:MAG: hypothetical protein RXP98_06700, partial [Thermoplasmata archaeon]
DERIWRNEIPIKCEKNLKTRKIEAFMDKNNYSTQHMDRIKLNKCFIFFKHGGKIIVSIRGVGKGIL